MRRRDAFTLVELLVAMALTAVLAWGVVVLYQSSMRVASTAALEAELVQHGRAALDRLCGDLEQLEPPAAGYLRIESGTATGTGFDGLRFVAPIGPEGRRAHVPYQVRDLPRRPRMLCRLMRWPVEDAEIPADDAYGQVAPLGVRLDHLSIEWIGLDGATAIGGRTWRAADGCYPRSVLVTIGLSDPHGRVRLVLTSGAVLRTSGL